MKQKKKFIKPETKVFPVHLEKLMQNTSDTIIAPENKGILSGQGTNGGDATFLKNTDGTDNTTIDDYTE